MTQKSCKSSPEPNVTEEEVRPNQVVSPQTSSGNEAAEMVEAVLSMSDHDQQPNEQDNDDESDSDSESFWAYEEYAIIKEYYENEDNDQEEEEQELLIMTEIKSESDQSN